MFTVVARGKLMMRKVGIGIEEELPGQPHDSQKLAPCGRTVSHNMAPLAG